MLANRCLVIIQKSTVKNFLHIFCLTLNIAVIKIAPVSKKGRSSTFPCSHLTMSRPEIHTV